MSVWTPETFRLFLSHVSSYKKTAEYLKDSLSIYNVSCFVAHNDIEPTKEWQGEIEEALRSMDALAALLTPDFHASNWTDQELGFAMGRGVLVISLRLGQDPYGFIGKYQGYPIAGKNYQDIAKDVISILSKHDTTSLRMADVLVRRLAQSNTWESSKRTMTMLEECTRFDSDLLERMEKALAENSQVKDAWGVSDRIRALIEKYSKKDAI